jgi:hypothetical protein
MENEPDYEWRHKFDARYKSGNPKGAAVGYLLFGVLIIIAIIAVLVLRARISENAPAASSPPVGRASP